MFKKKITDMQIMESILDLIAVGVSVQQAIRRLSLAIKDPEMADKLEVVADLIETEGYTLGDAMREANMAVKYTDILNVGQKTGNLERVMKEVIETQTAISTIIGKVKSSLYYPIAVVVFSILISYGITFVIEKIIISLSSPAVEKTIGFRTASFIVSHREAIVLSYIAVLAVLLYVAYKKIDKLPVIGKIYNAIILGQAFRMFSLGILSGLSTTKSFEFSAKMLRGRWREVFEVMGEEATGRTLSDMVDDLEELINPEDYLILKMKIEAGSIGEGFGNVGSRYISKAIRQLEGLSSLASIGATLLVAFQVVAMMSPIFMIISSFMDSVSNFGK